MTAKTGALDKPISITSLDLELAWGSCFIQKMTSWVHFKMILTGRGMMELLCE